MTLSCSIHPLIQHQGPVVMKKSSPKTPYQMAKNVITTVILESKNDYKLVKYIVSMQTCVQIGELSIQLYYIILNHYIYILGMNFIYQSKFAFYRIKMYYCQVTTRANPQICISSIKKVTKEVTLKLVKLSILMDILQFKMEKSFTSIRLFLSKESLFLKVVYFNV